MSKGFATNRSRKERKISFHTAVILPTSIDRLTLLSREGIHDGRNPVARFAEIPMLLKVDKSLRVARWLSAADPFLWDVIEQAPLHIFSGVEFARARSGQVHPPTRMG